jgi:hypothetical protein
LRVQSLIEEDSFIDGVLEHHVYMRAILDHTGLDFLEGHLGWDGGGEEGVERIN